MTFDELEDGVGFVTRNIISTDSATFLHREGDTRRIPGEGGESGAALLFETLGPVTYRLNTRLKRCV